MTKFLKFALVSTALTFSVLQTASAQVPLPYFAPTAADSTGVHTNAPQKLQTHRSVAVSPARKENEDTATQPTLPIFYPY